MLYRVYGVCYSYGIIYLHNIECFNMFKSAVDSHLSWLLFINQCRVIIGFCPVSKSSCVYISCTYDIQLLHIIYVLPFSCVLL